VEDFMPTIKGFVSSLQVRSDGWVEVELLAPHNGNARQRVFVQDLDGAPGEANRRLSQIGLLRDALARSLPVEIDYRGDHEIGDVVDDVTVLPRASLAGRSPARRVVGVVVGLAVTESGPVSATSPYADPPDFGTVTLLVDDGSLLQAVIDLQRPDSLMAQHALGMLSQAQRTRRPVALTLAMLDGARGQGEPRATATSGRKGSAVVVAVEFEVVPTGELVETYAFAERLTQRYESYETDEAAALSQVRVQYTTAPAQTPEGDISDNGSFVPTPGVAWVHGDSPLRTTLNQALSERLMVRLGLQGDRVHEVVLVAPMGSAARPVWIEMRRRLLPAGAGPLCGNMPTVQSPDGRVFADLPLSVSWVGHGYFAPGLWRFVLVSDGRANLTIDCKSPCLDEPDPSCAETPSPSEHRPCCTASAQQDGPTMRHAYLCGVHRVEIVLSGHACSGPFDLRAYRIR
jgi:hypothetical protein